MCTRTMQPYLRALCGCSVDEMLAKIKQMCGMDLPESLKEEMAEQWPEQYPDGCRRDPLWRLLNLLCTVTPALCQHR